MAVLIKTAIYYLNCMVLIIGIVRMIMGGIIRINMQNKKVPTIIPTISITCISIGT
jgi:hypothetical protein